jgi:hypothetical protein
MTLAHRLADLVGCTIVHVEGDHVVIWNGSMTFLQYRIIGENIVEAGMWVASSPPETTQIAVAMAGMARYR